MRRLILLITIIMIGVVGITQGQHNHEKKDIDRRELQSKKVAYLTTYLELTPEESASFWPVYNKMSSEYHKNMSESKELRDSITEAVKDDKKSDYSELIDQFQDINSRREKINSRYYTKFRNILSDEKLARLIVGEHEFRRVLMKEYRKKKEAQPSDR